jgi:tetratricopeptide (TPR) repeat protein
MGERQYAFRHALVRDVAYGQLPRAARVDKHRRAAEWIQALSPDRVEDRAELLAHHWLAAVEFARAAGQDTTILAERARLALRDAGDRALDLNAFAAAARWCAATLALWPMAGPERPWLLLRLGEARFHAEQAGDEELAVARDGLLAQGDREAAAEAEVLLSRLARSHGLGEATMEHARYAGRLLEATGPSRAKALVLVNLASTLMESGRSQEAIQIGREALAIADELGLDELRGRALNYLGCARFEGGDFAGAADLEQAVAITVQVNSPYIAAAYGNLAILLIALGDLTQAFELQAKGRQAAERFALAGELRWSRQERIDKDYWQGRWDAALRGANEFLAESEAGSRNFVEVGCRLVRGRIRLARGDRDDALQDTAAALELARQAREPQTLQLALALQARAMLAAGSVEKASGLASELLAMLARQRSVAAEPGWSGDLAVVLQALGRGAELVGFAADVTALTPWLQAATAVATGEFGRAADIYAEIGSRPDEAFARLSDGRWFLANGRKAEGSAQLGRALAFYHEVGAVAYLREGETLLAASA